MINHYCFVQIIMNLLLICHLNETIIEPMFKKMFHLCSKNCFIIKRCGKLIANEIKSKLAIAIKFLIWLIFCHATFFFLFIYHATIFFLLFNHATFEMVV